MSRSVARVALAVVSAVCLCMVGLARSAAPAAADVGAPTWWNGDCDANHWNAAAATVGWTGTGAHRLGASYLGVPVCGPRRSGEGAPDVQWLRPGWGHFEWECTELAFRFMAQIYGVSAYGANGVDVVANYRPSYGGALTTIANGTPGKAPAPGDIISFNSASSPAGHVAVVAGTTIDPNGNGTVLLMSQNDTANGWRTLTVTNWTVNGFGSEVPSAWLHDPAGRGGTGTIETSVVVPQDLGDGPGAGTAGDGTLDVFARGADDALWARHFVNGAWSAWWSLGGIIKSQPAVVSVQPGTLDVYVRGADNAVWSRHFANGAWSAWWSLGGGITNAVSVVSASPGTADVFAVGTDAALWTRHLANGGWGPWTSMGGIVTSAPSTASASANTISVFDRGADGALWTRQLAGGFWSPWTSMGGLLSSSPTSSSPASGVIDVFARGADGAMWSRHLAVGTWTSWFSLGGYVTSPPSSASPSPSTVDLFARGGDNALWTRQFLNGTWGPWTTLGGILR